MKKISVLILSIIMVWGLVACGSTEEPIVDTEQAGQEEQKTTSLAEYENMTLELQDATVVTTEEGNKLLKVVATYTNANTEPYYAYCSFGVKALQNGVGLNDVSNINGDEAALIKELKDGASLEVHYLFELTDDSEVEVLVTEPTADADVIGQKNYTVTE